MADENKEDGEYTLQLHIPFKDPESRIGYSEKLVKRRLERQGWTVWRGELVGLVRHAIELYPNVERKYRLLCDLIERYHPGTLEELQYINSVHHGMPDYVAFKDGKFKFVECKIGYEQLRPGQKICIMKLKAMGFHVEIHRLAEPQTKNRLTHVNVRTGEKRIREHQQTLVRYLKRARKKNTEKILKN